MAKEMTDKLAGAVALVLTVDEVADITPRLRAVWLTTEVDDFSYEPGQDLMLHIPAGDEHIRRRYTIRRVDDRGRIEIWFVLHGHGPAAQWASAAAPGDRIDVIGPRGKVTVVPGRDWHLLAGDDSGIAALLAMAEAVPPPATAVVVAEVEGPDDEVEATVAVQWLHRNGAPAGDNDLLERALTTLELPPGEGHAYLAGEKATVKRLRTLLEGRGLDRDHQSPKAYWDRTRANAGHGEPLPDGWTGPEPGARRP